jgi:aspartate-semialdehyde dehydrogenase
MMNIESRGETREEKKIERETKKNKETKTNTQKR